MIEFLKRLFIADNSLQDLIKSGAQIVDVRTPAEYASGHLKSSINIPLNELPHKLSALKKDKAIITCCASGMRSLSALNILKSAGFKEVRNGGSWKNLKKYEQ